MSAALVFLSAAAAGAAGDGATPGVEGKALDLCPHAEAARLRELTERSLPAAREADADTDVQHYLLDIEIVPETSGPNFSNVRVEGTCTIDVASTVANLSEFTVDLHSVLTVSAVSGNVAGWVRSDDTVVIALDQSYGVGESFQVAVTYAGYPASAGFGAFKWWVRNGNLVVGTLSEPYYARNWWPCKDVLGDKATMQMHVTVPTGMIAASNGNDEGTVPVAGGRTKFMWHESYPMVPYLASLAITNYQRYDLTYFYDVGRGTQSPRDLVLRDNGLTHVGARAASQPQSRLAGQTMPVPCYLYPDHWDFDLGQPQAAYKSACDELLVMLDVFNAGFGHYPFIAEKYGIAETGGTGGFTANMEHQTLSSMVTVANNTHIMAHELAHHWWGDDVTCATWYDIWLNEGFASYAEALYQEGKPGGGASAFWSRLNERRPLSPSNQVYRTSIGSVSAIFSTNDVYRKGAWVLHMLRGTIGDEAFYQALADYRAAHAYGSATTADFAADISASFGADLSWFTDQWVMNPGSPRYEWNYASSVIDSQTWLKLRITQTQNAQGYGIFTMPVRMRVTTASGVETHTVWNDDWVEHHVLPIAGAPTLVEFDRDGGVSNRNWILFQSATQVATAVSAPPVLLPFDWSPFDGSATDSTLVLRFSEYIGSFEASDFTLVGMSSGAQSADTISYDPAAFTATLTFAALPHDSYTLTLIADNIVANGQALDGEVEGDTWHDQTLLPSGDGQAGGDAVLALHRQLGDADGDGDVDLADAAVCVACLTGPLGGPPAPQCHACDLDQDGDVDLRDASGMHTVFDD